MAASFLSVRSCASQQTMQLLLLSFQFLPLIWIKRPWKHEAAGGATACRYHSARISDCIVLPWWSCSEWTVEGTAHQSLWQQLCPLHATDEQWMVGNGHKQEGGEGGGGEHHEGYKANTTFLHLSVFPWLPLAWFVYHGSDLWLVKVEFWPTGFTSGHNYLLCHH